jgi:tetraacyldisaccharide 4'-kinase
MVKPPTFWYDTHSILGKVLAPLGWGYHVLGRLRYYLVKPYKCEVPVICVGNLVLGGAGKTPTVIALVELLKQKGLNPHIITRGYRGQLTGNHQVNLKMHTYQDVGDEPLLLAQHAPTWVGKDRKTSANQAIAAGANVLIMDDGFQNPTLFQNMKILVVDAYQGMGNGQVFPAGPLRETVTSGLKKADVIMLLNGDLNFPTDKPIFKANFEVVEPPSLERVVGFAGLGFPEKFRQTLVNQGYTVCQFHSFPDHYPYQENDMLFLEQCAREHKAILVTTAKDALRVPQKWKSNIGVLKIKLKIYNPASFLKTIGERVRLKLDLS